MASSGSYDFALTRDNIIEHAFQHIGALGDGESASATQLAEGARLLNMIVKMRHAVGMPAWAIKRGYILPFTGASSINTDSHVVTNYDATTITSTAASGATTVEVVSNSGITAADQIGIEQSGGTMQWTTVSSVTNSVVTLAATLGAEAAAGGRVYTYTAASERVEKPLRIIDANMLEVAGNSSWNIEVQNRNDYYELGNRATAGTPNQMYYTIRPSSDTALNTNGQIFVYPRFNNGDYVIEFTYTRPFQDFDSSSDNPDFPQAFYLPLMVELAAMLGPKHGVTIDERRMLFKEAEAYWSMALDTIYEEGSLFIQPERN